MQKRKYARTAQYGIGIKRRTTICGILLGNWKRRKVVIDARMASSSGVARTHVSVESGSLHISSCATMAGSGSRAAAQPTSNSSDTGLIFKRGPCLVLFIFTVCSQSFGGHGPSCWSSYCGSLQLHSLFV